LGKEIVEAQFIRYNRGNFLEGTEENYVGLTGVPTLPLHTPARFHTETKKKKKKSRNDIHVNVHNGEMFTVQGF
jgi:hypothetical protein